MQIAITLDSQKWQYVAQILATRPYAEVKDTIEELEAQFDKAKMASDQTPQTEK